MSPSLLVIFTEHSAGWHNYWYKILPGFVLIKHSLGLSLELYLPRRHLAGLGRCLGQALLLRTSGWTVYDCLRVRCQI